MTEFSTAPRPMAIGDILDGTFRLYRNNFLLFLAIAALAQVPLLIFQVAFQSTAGVAFTTDYLELIENAASLDPNNPFEDLPLASIGIYLIGSLLFSLFQYGIVQQLMNGALINAAAQRYQGEAVSVLGSYSFSLGTALNLILSGFVVGLISFFSVVIFMVVTFGAIFGLAAMVGASAFASGDGSGVASLLIGLLIGALALVLGLGVVVGLFYILLRFVFVPQAVVLERQGIFGALGRSWQLVGGSFWRILGIVLLITLLTTILVGIPVGILSFVMQILLGNLEDPLQNLALVTALNTIITALATILILPVSWTAMTLLYFDVRMRREGSDIVQRLQEQPGLVVER